jgi:hypothetical protein
MKHAAIKAVIAIAAAGTLATVAAPVSQAAGTAPAYWRLAYRVSWPRQNYVVAVGAIGPRDAWAVGAQDGPEAGYVLRWNGRHWRRLSNPVLTSDPTGLTAISDTNVWVYESFDAVHWNGHTWSQIAFPLYSGAAAGAAGSELWLYGSVRGNGTHWTTRTWRLDAGSWHTYTLPIQITSFSVYSTTDAWAVGAITASGYPGVGKLAAYRWNGSSWTRQRIPALDGPAGVAVQSVHSVWLSALRVGRAPYTDLLEHWDGHRWSAHRMPLPYGGVPPAPVPYRRGAWWYQNELWTGSRWISPQTVLPRSCQSGQVMSMASVPRSAGAWAAMFCEGPRGGWQSGAIGVYGAVP